MKKTLFLLLAMLYSLFSWSQAIEGQWQGRLKLPASSLRLVFNIQEADGELSATMDSPDQGATGITVSSISFVDSVLHLEVAAANITYEARMDNEGKLDGTFKQGYLSLPLRMHKGHAKANNSRPQMPQPPFPYKQEEVTFASRQAGVHLAASLSIPNGKAPFPAVVLISGSGPQDRDETLFGHKPFLVLSDYLTRKGFVVLRYDDRGVGKSTSDFALATSYDLMHDALGAVHYLRQRSDIDADRISLLGHSEGGLLAFMIAADDPQLACVVALSAPSLRGDSLLLLQKQTLELKMGVPAALVARNQRIFKGAYALLNAMQHDDDLADSLSQYFTEQYGAALSQPQKKALVQQLTQAWVRGFVGIDPAKYLRQISCPILAIYGSKDVQVPAQDNMERLGALVADSSLLSIVNMQQLNHLLQACESGLPSEYGNIEQTMHPQVLDSIAAYLKKQLTKPKMSPL